MIIVRLLGLASLFQDRFYHWCLPLSLFPSSYHILSMWHVSSCEFVPSSTTEIPSYGICFYPLLLAMFIHHLNAEWDKSLWLTERTYFGKKKNLQHSNSVPKGTIRCVSNIYIECEQGIDNNGQALTQCHIYIEPFIQQQKYLYV